MESLKQLYVKTGIFNFSSEHKRQKESLEKITLSVFLGFSDNFDTLITD